ncbi:hypothetical protein GCM10017673_12410 [Streptosporangium violaceochromogenes]|nr:hypothetical protein GCM10017673_12410 [Streptosporangium violaceochromogenes]
MLTGVREHHYRHRDGQDQPAQRRLRAARQTLASLVPAGMMVKASRPTEIGPSDQWIARPERRLKLFA